MAITGPSPAEGVTTIGDDLATKNELRNAPLTRVKRRTLWFFALMVVVLGVIFYSLGLVIVQQFRDAQSRSAARANAIYVQGILDPHVEVLAADGALTAANRDQIDALLARTSLGKHLIGLVIWDLNGQEAFSTIGNRREDVLDTDEFQMALAGKLGIELIRDRDSGEPVQIPTPYFEVYVPLYGKISDTPVAVGEVYTDASIMLAEQADAEWAVWFVLASAMAGIVGLSAIALLFRLRLLQQLDVARSLVGMNRKLTQAADRERVAATQSNEELLNLLGAEIHDGPIQMLSLLMLTLGKDDADAPKSAGMTKVQLATGVMADLRAISSGLILPEIRNLGLASALSLAVARHEELTGDRIAADFSALPPKVDAGLAICLYRFVQEGLSNSNRHADHSGVLIDATMAKGILEIVIRDRGPADGAQKTAVPGHRGLGLQGIRNRLAIYGGALTLTANQLGGNDLRLKVVVANGTVPKPG